MRNTIACGVQHRPDRERCEPRAGKSWPGRCAAARTGWSFEVFIVASATRIAMKDAALMRKQPPTPAVTIKTPATAGPIARAALTMTLLSETAFPIESGPTISGTNACRVGLSTALVIPNPVATSITIQSRITWVRSSRPSVIHQLTVARFAN